MVNHIYAFQLTKQIKHVLFELGHSLGTYLNEWSRELEGEAGARYKVRVVGTRDMTEEELPGTFEGKFRIELPGKQYMLFRLTKVGA